MTITMATEKSTKIEDILSELGKKIDVLIEEAKIAKDTVRDDLEVKIEELKKKKEKIEEDFEEYKQKESWQDAKNHFSNAIDEIKQAVESLISSIRK
jgi:ribosome recycling factor